MGREAICVCKWGDTSGEVTAHLESTELILRRPSIKGPKRRRIPISAIEKLRIEGAKADRLSFEFEGQTITLSLGPIEAKKWETSLRKGPPTLTKKLGITQATTLDILGPIDDPRLEEALSAAAGSNSEPNLTVARVDTPEDLVRLLLHTKSRHTPLWVIYPKGPGKAINEAHIRTTLRDLDMIDTKVASVSPTLTALRFQPRSN